MQPAGEERGSPVQGTACSALTADSRGQLGWSAGFSGRSAEERLSERIPRPVLHGGRRAERLRQVHPAAGTGTVLLDGQAIGKPPAEGVGPHPGAAAAAVDSPDRITVADLVADGRCPHRAPLREWSARGERIVAESMAATGIGGLAEQYTDELWGGQGQRVRIAKAIARRTPLPLGEPTTYLGIQAPDRRARPVRAAARGTGPHSGRRPSSTTSTTRRAAPPTWSRRATGRWPPRSRRWWPRRDGPEDGPSAREPPVPGPGGGGAGAARAVTAAAAGPAGPPPA